MAILSEVKEIEYASTCSNNYVYLSWLNSLGGYDSWVFELSNKQAAIIDKSVSFNQVTSDFDANIKQSHKKSTDTITVYAYEDSNKIGRAHV